MHRDEIIAEVWRNREAYAKAHHHSLDEMVADLRRREKEHVERVVERRRTPGRGTVPGAASGQPH